MTANQSLSTNLSPPSGGEHDAPIHLISGYPRGIAVLLSLFLGISSLLAINLVHLHVWISILASLGVCLVSAQWLWATLSSRDMSLVIFPDGEVYCSGLKSIVLRGVLHERSWRRSQVACIEVKFPWGIESFVVFSVLQRKSEFRRLKIWLLHSRTEVQIVDY